MRMIIRLALLTVACVLTACGDGDSSASSNDAASGSPGFPVTVEHKFGTTEVPAAPERVVAVGYTDQDHVLAFGVVPVGVGDFLGGYDWRNRPWAKEALGGAEPEVVSGQQINFEAVAAQRPDLIFAINAGLKEGDYERLSRIAPTVAQSGEYIDFGMPWEEQTMLVGRALGQEERARQIVSELEDKFERVRIRESRVRRQDGDPRLRRARRLRRLRDGRHAQPLPHRPRLRAAGAHRRAGRRQLLHRVQPGAVPPPRPGARGHVRP